MKKLDHLSRAELEAEIQRLKTQSDLKQAKREIAQLRANLADWILNQTEPAAKNVNPSGRAGSSQWAICR